MDESFLYKTRVPKGIYLYPVVIIIIAFVFMYFNVPLLTTYFYLVIAGIILYRIYIIRNPITCVVSVYTDRIIINLPFRFKKDKVYYYNDIHSEFIVKTYKVNSIFIWKRYILICSFLYGEDAKTVGIYISPNFYDFMNAYELIIHKLQLYKKSISDTLKEGSKETGANIVYQFGFKGLDKDEIIELYKSENISEEIAEQHFADLDKIKDKELNYYIKDYSSAGYLMVAIGIILVFSSIISGNGRLIIWAIFAFIIGIRTILKINKTKRNK